MNPKLFPGNTCWGKTVLRGSHFPRVITQWKPLITITLGLALFDNNNRLITLSGGYKNLHYLTQFIVTSSSHGATTLGGFWPASRFCNLLLQYNILHV
jgi:hypothetical protein